MLRALAKREEGGAWPSRPMDMCARFFFSGARAQTNVVVESMLRSIWSMVRSIDRYRAMLMQSSATGSRTGPTRIQLHTYTLICFLRSLRQIYIYNQPTNQ
jgi:hypothetical protein